MDTERVVGFLLCMIVSSTMSGSLSYMVRIRNPPTTMIRTAENIRMTGITNMSSMTIPPETSVKDVKGNATQNFEDGDGGHFKMDMGMLGINEVQRWRVAALALCALAVVMVSVAGFAFFIYQHEQQFKQYYVQVHGGSDVGIGVSNGGGIIRWNEIADDSEQEEEEIQVVVQNGVGVGNCASSSDSFAVSQKTKKVMAKRGESVSKGINRDKENEKLIEIEEGMANRERNV